MPGQTRPSRKRQVKKYAYDGVKEVHKRRYLLQPIAVEVFCADGQTQLLAFLKDVRTKVRDPPQICKQFFYMDDFLPFSFLWLSDLYYLTKLHFLLIHTSVINYTF